MKNNFFSLGALLVLMLAGAIAYVALKTTPGSHHAPTTSHTLTTPEGSTHIMPAKTTQSADIELDKQEPISVIFDLNGVLFQISEKQALNKLGLIDTISYTLAGKNPEDLKNKLFDILYLINKESPEMMRTKTDDILPKHYDRRLPKIMCDWMLGTISTDDIIKQTHACIATLDDTYFSSSLEKKLITKIVSLMFSADVRCQVYAPIKTGVRLLQKCKNLGYKVFLLSNMDTELITLLEEKYSDIFDLFDGMVISATVGMMKPYKNIYEYTLNTFDLSPTSTYFFDDEIVNIAGAEQAGIVGVQFSKASKHKFKRKLATLEILPELYAS